MAKSIRQQAETLVRQRFSADEPGSQEDLRSTVHELRVHQIELELQNDELRRTQEQLKLAQRRYFELYNLAPVAYLTLDEQGVVLDINLTGVDLLGKTRNRLIGKPLLAYLSLNSTARFFENLTRLFETATDQVTELELKPSGGLPTTVHAVSRLAHEDDRPVCRMALINISRQKQAELGMRQSEERFRQFAESIDQVLWITTRSPRKVLFVNRAFTRIWGQPVEALYETPSIWEESIHPDDHQRVLDAFDRWVQRQSATYQEEYRVVRPDGSICWVQDNGANVLYEGNRPVRMSGIAKDITPRKQAEEQQRQHEQLLRMALEAARMGIWSRDLETDKLTWSEQHGPVVGLPAGTKIEHRDDFLALIHPDDHHLLDEATARALNGQPYHCVYRITWPDGTLRWLEARGQLYQAAGAGQPQRLTGTVMDITAQKEAEDKLKQTLAYYHTLFEDTPTSLWEEDFSAAKTILNQLQASGVSDLATYLAENPDEVYRLWNSIRIIDVNQATIMLYNATDKSHMLNGLSPLEGRPKTFASFSRQLLAIAAGQTHFSGEATSKTYDGRELDVIVYWSVVPGFEESYGRVLVAIVDVTDLKQTEAALRAERALLAARVAERTAELVQANRLKDQFLATMSHELRTPLNVIFGNVELLLEELYGPLTDKQVRSLNSIGSSGRHLLALINDILDLSEIETEELKLVITPVSIEAICRESLEVIQETARQKSIRTHSQIDPPVTTIEADEQRLRQILVNLLTNAVKFTPKGGRVGLEVWLRAATGTVEFTVWDTGIGINQADINIMFNPFVQLDGGLNRQEEGTGLGLTLVQRLTALHGGTVAVESTPGRGSRFTVSLPLTRPVGP
ncbi:MAG: hypothetical protein Kow0031_21710 [Anaerolineae bacterium]